jgi:uncharacterized Zn-finger protein
MKKHRFPVGYRLTTFLPCYKGSFDEEGKIQLRTFISVRDFHECVKEHVCEQCGKAFHAKSILAAHVRTHTGEKPFQVR